MSGTVEKAIRCSFCEKPVSIYSGVCAYCGKELSPPITPADLDRPNPARISRSAILVWGLVVAAAVSIVLLFVVIPTLIQRDMHTHGKEMVSWSDPRVIQLLATMDKVDRASKGFLPLEKSADLAFFTNDHKDKVPGDTQDNYDYQLSVAGKVGHEVFFQKAPSGYRWIAEEEVFTGPRKYKIEDPDDDSLTNETIDIQYHTETVNGIPSDSTSIYYSGDDPRLCKSPPYYRNDLTLGEVAPILKEWHYDLPKEALRPHGKSKP